MAARSPKSRAALPWPDPPRSRPSRSAPDGEGWLHEIKHDGHRLAGILGGRGGLMLISRSCLGPHATVWLAHFSTCYHA